MTSKQINLRRKYINQAFTQPGSGFLNQGSESALSPPTSFLIQLVSICPGSQPAASQRGEQAAATPLPTAYFLTGCRKAENSLLNSAWWRLASLPYAQGNERSWEQLPLTASLIPCSSPSAGSDVFQPHLSPPWAKAMPAPHTCWRLPHILRESPEGDLQVLRSLQRVQATNQPGKLDP